MQHIIVNLFHFSVITLSPTSSFLLLLTLKASVSRLFMSTDGKCRTDCNVWCCLSDDNGSAGISHRYLYYLYYLYHLYIHGYQRISQQTFYIKSHHKLRITSPLLSSDQHQAGTSCSSVNQNITTLTQDILQNWKCENRLWLRNGNLRIRY